MIAATLQSGLPVEVESALFGAAQIKSFGGRPISQAYSGGRGYVNVSWNSVPLCEIEAVTTIDDPEHCDALQNWLSAMEDSDNLDSDETLSACATLEIEHQARQQFANYIHTHSIAPGTHANEITPKFAGITPQHSMLWEELNAADVFASGMALSR